MANAQIAKLRETFQKMVEGMESYSLILLDETGTILTWNKGAEKLKGYSASEIIGQHFRIFYLPGDRQAGKPEQLMKEARAHGSASFVGRRIRKNGSIFWGKAELTAIKDEDGRVIGFTKLARELHEESAMGQFWFDMDGVLNLKLGVVPQTPEGIAEYRRTVKSVSGGKKVCVIADAQEAQLTPQGLAFSAEGIQEIYKAVALVSDMPDDANTVALLSIIPKDIPAKVFKTHREAKEWIRQYL